MFLQCPYPFPSVMTNKLQAQAIPHVGGPWASREGAGAYLSRPWEAQIVHLGLVLRLTDRQPYPVGYGLRPVHASRGAVINPAVRSTPHYGHGIHLQSLTR